MHQLFSVSLLISDRTPMPVGARDGLDSTVRMRVLAAGAESNIDDAKEQTVRLADLSDSARQLNRPQQADRFLLLAWLAFDFVAEPAACAPAA
jgi:hypothetical protein